MQTKPRFRDGCEHGVKRFISTINNKDIYTLSGPPYSRENGFCVRYGNRKSQFYDTHDHDFSHLIKNIYGDGEE